LPNPAASWASSILLPPHVDHLLDLLLILRLQLAELPKERLPQNLIAGLRGVVEQIVGRDLQSLGDAGQLLPGGLAGVAVLEFPDVALA
jgi:hypothetical protein